MEMPLKLPRQKTSLKVIATTLLALMVWPSHANVSAKSSDEHQGASADTSKTSLTVSTVYQGLHKPWGITHLSADLFLITERNGQVRLWNNATATMSGANTQFSDSVYESGQGGMLDVIAHPDYVQNQWVYFTFASGHRFSNGTTLARAKLDLENLDKSSSFTLQNIQILFRATPQKAATYHFAGRMAFLPDNSLVFGVGDGYSYMDDAQKLDSHLGKIVRLKDNGEVPSDNPYVGTDGALPEIYSIGHRNPQGLFYDKQRGLLFSNEHGPKGGDEINVIKPKLNYGWPKITYGIDYSGLEITPHKTMPGLESPLVNWTPSIAPGSLLIYSGGEFPAFQNKLLSTALKYQEMRVVALTKKNKPIDDAANDVLGSTKSHSGLALLSEQTYLKDVKERLRDIVEDEQGRLLIVTDSGKLLRVSKGN